jgi:hypothetical protein
LIEPDKKKNCEEYYNKWLLQLERQLN